MNLDALRQGLAAQHVILTVSEVGRLKYQAPGPIPASLVESLKEHKTALLDELTASSFTEAAPPTPHPATPGWVAIGQQPGYCGSCARFTLSPDWGPLMGECGAPSGAWWPESAPLSIHMGHACGAEGGRAYRARNTALEKTS